MWAEIDYTYSAIRSNTPLLEELFTTTIGVCSVCEGVHALIILTEWYEFKELDCIHLFKPMIKPVFTYDEFNILDHDELKEIGFDAHVITNTVYYSTIDTNNQEVGFNDESSDITGIPNRGWNSNIKEPIEN
eukprot:15359040-Ditylum_brightwellii.AAC.1